MADRYWVGGSGSWNSTTKWSTTSGGASGASVPTILDNAIFDTASSASHYTVTVTDNASCANLTVSPPTVDGVTQFSVGINFIVAGTFSTSNTQGNRRLWFRSSTYGLMRDMNVAAFGAVSDVDFRDIRITGAGGTLTGTRIGNLRGNKNITFSTPKNCYRIDTGTWSGNRWSATSGGTVSTDYFPLAQDAAVFDENTTGGTYPMDSAIPYTGTVDMSARTTPLTLNFATGYTIYGNWINSTTAGTATSAYLLTFSGRNTQTITSAGRNFNGIIIDSYGGTVKLADALSCSVSCTVTNGTFITNNYNFSIGGSLNSNSSNVRAIKLGSSTVTLLAAISVDDSRNLTFDAGTSTIQLTNSNSSQVIGNRTAGPPLTFYNIIFNFQNTANTSNCDLIGTNTFNNISIIAPYINNTVLSTYSNQTITGTLTVDGALPNRRNFIFSETIGSTRTLTVGTLSADDCDFRDITIAGAAAGSSPTRAGDCGGNSGITFPSPKTVYWNLAGTQNWSATAWASSSGGTPDINNFPLAQDTVIFDNAGSAGTVIIDQNWNIGTFDASARTNAMTLSGSAAPTVYGDWTFGTGVTCNTTSIITFSKQGTQTITSNGVIFTSSIGIVTGTGTVQLGDALTINTGSTTSGISHASGTFDAVTYNVTTPTYSSSTGNTRTLKMGTGTWTLTGTGTGVWNISSSLNFYKGTADIVLSDTSTAARGFWPAGFSYNKLTIGGTTGTSQLTFYNAGQFTELASTKTVAHSINFASGATLTIGKWTVTGTAGNMVSLTGTGTNHILAGACTDGIDYLAMGSIAFSASSTGEFYAGANSTGTAAAPVYRTSKPADSTRYWVGGTGNWSDTARWSTSSGGVGGADVPRSHDDVVFDSNSNATAYTATVNAVTGGIRMKSLTIAGPASGNVTLAGTTAIYGIHGDVTLPATGLTRTYTGVITLSGSTTGNTLTTNGVVLASAVTVNGVNCGWVLGSSFVNSNSLSITNGSFDTAGYALTVTSLASDNGNERTIALGASLLSISATSAISFGTTVTSRANLTVTAGTSQINCSIASPTFSGNNQTFYNVNFTNTGTGTVTINGANSFNNLSFAGVKSVGLKVLSIAADQTVTGTLSFPAGNDATMRNFCRSDTIGTTRTITAAAFSGTDVDFRDITIAGAAAPVSGTRLGDCKGNSGITFDAAANKYWNLAAGGNWGGAIGWATSSGGTPAINNFPLAQDTCIFEATGLNSGATVTVNQSYNIGTIDMSARTTSTMTLATSTLIPSIYGNWINGTGTTLTGTGAMTFAGRGSRTITSAGKTFTQGFTIDSPNGSVILQDAFSCNRAIAGALTITSGTFDANSFNVTLSGSTGTLSSNVTNTRTIAIGSGTWTIAGSGTAWNISSTNLTVTGTGTILLTSQSAKTFSGGDIAYTDITLDQGGAGTLTFSGNNTFKNIAKSYTGAATINMSTHTQTVSQWTATGTSGNILTLQGTSSTSPGNLIYTGSVKIDLDYLALIGVRAYPSNKWYAGTNSSNSGTFDWLFTTAPPPVTSTSEKFFLLLS